MSGSLKAPRIVLIGPAGAGKGTQSEKIDKEFKLGCTLSTGDLLRAEVDQGTPLGKKAKAIMDRGELVPDEIMLDMIHNNLARPECRGGWILDGFPRTVAQAEKLDAMLEKDGMKPDAALEFKVNEELLVRRVTGRLVHPGSGRVYHMIDHPPKAAMKDDVTGEPLIQRSDDNPETLKRRLDSYKKNTEPVLGYYRKQGILAVIDASRSMNEVWSQVKSSVLAALNKRQ